MNRIAQRFSMFRRAQDGIAYLEFALCLPFLLALFMGAVEVTRYILIAQKVEKTVVTISDVIAQGSTISNSDLNNLIVASSQVMQPYVMGANGYVIVSSVKQTGTYSAGNPPRVDWQYTSSGTNGSWVQSSLVGSTGSAATLPGGMTLFDKDNVIVTEIYYNYQPLLSTNGVITGGTIYKTSVYKPRLGDLSTLSALPFWLMQKGVLL